MNTSKVIEVELKLDGVRVTNCTELSETLLLSKALDKTSGHDESSGRFFSYYSSYVYCPCRNHLPLFTDVVEKNPKAWKELPDAY